MDRARGNQKLAKTKRDRALERNEFRQPSAPRRSATGATSFPLKAEDPEIRKMIDAALYARATLR